MNEVREFITTYNLHFLTNYAAEEFILTEKKADYIDIKFNSSFEAKRMMTWLDKNISPVNNQLYDGAYREGQSIIQFEDVPNVDALMKKLKSARINFKVDTMKEEIMNEGSVTEKKASYIEIRLDSPMAAKRMMAWLDKNISPVNNQLYDGAYREGQSIIQFEDVPNIDALERKLRTSGINFNLGFAPK